MPGSCPQDSRSGTGRWPGSWCGNRPAGIWRGGKEGKQRDFSAGSIPERLRSRREFLNGIKVPHSQPPHSCRIPGQFRLFQLGYPSAPEMETGSWEWLCTSTPQIPINSNSTTGISSGRDGTGMGLSGCSMMGMGGWGRRKDGDEAEIPGKTRILQLCPGT